MAIPLQDSVVYGPIRSRRLGTSLGINILPADVKFCLSDCRYCQYGWTDSAAMKKAKLPSADILLGQIESSFENRSAGGLPIDCLTFSGNGEPTLHPELAVLVDQVKRLRDTYFPKAQVTIFSDSTRVCFPRVRAALNRFDKRCMKLDAGCEEIYQILNRPLVKGVWEKTIQGLTCLPEVTLQSLFVQGAVDNSGGPFYAKWIETLRRIQPKEVYIYTLDRPPADPRIEPVPTDRLQAIRREVEDKLGIHTSVY